LAGRCDGRSRKRLLEIASVRRKLDVSTKRVPPRIITRVMSIVDDRRLALGTVRVIVGGAESIREGPRRTRRRRAAIRVRGARWSHLHSGSGLALPGYRSVMVANECDSTKRGDR